MINKKLFNKYLAKVSSVKEGTFTALYNDILNGKNSYLRLNKKGSSMFDPTWIKIIEDCLFELGEIINNPSEVTTQDSSVVPIELAKKVDGVSVQHLASHTQFIKEVDENGNVVPGKILAHFNKEELHTYENRFIATFIRRLVLFIEKRYEFIKNTISLESKEVLLLKNNSVVNGQEVEIETKIVIKKQMEDDVTVKAKEYMDRIALMREYITYYYNSSFMKEMKNEKDVRKPILQTNIIRKNPLYHKFYEVFMFIERFENLGVSYKIDEQYLDFSEKDMKKLNYLLLGTYLAIQDKDEYEVVKESTKVYKPKVLTSIDDEKFVYGEFVDGPIQFVRVDEQYRDYLSTLLSKSLPTHPTKQEKEYFDEDYSFKKNLLNALKEIDKIVSRKQKEIDKYEKYLAEYIKKREKEEAEEAKRLIEEMKKESEGLLEYRRQLILSAAEMQRGDIEEYLVEHPLESKQEEYTPDISTIDSILSVIPGHFIVRTPHGYYVDEKGFSEDRESAKVFEDFNLANQIKNRFGGKVVKL